MNKTLTTLLAASLGTLVAASSVAQVEPVDFQQQLAFAEKGNAVAQFGVGISYLNGEGVQKDAPQGIKFIEKAAQQGLVDAQLQLGTSYFIGKDVKKNVSQAVKWYEKAAQQGSVIAQFNLGVAYLNGEGVKASKAEAKRYMTLACNQGFDLACASLKKLK